MYLTTCRLVISADPCSRAYAILRARGPFKEERLTIEKSAGVMPHPLPGYQNFLQYLSAIVRKLRFLQATLPHTRRGAKHPGHLHPMTTMPVTVPFFS